MTTAAYADFSIKASCSNLLETEQKLIDLGPTFAGEDNQTDTYFAVPVGKMKLREGNIEHLLTHYLRREDAGKMKTTVFLYERNPSPEMIRQYTGHLDRIGQIVKRRRIYFIHNVKFHFDTLDNGNTFVEIEAIDRDGTIGLHKIRSQAENFQTLLGINKEDIILSSYIDMPT